MFSNTLRVAFVFSCAIFLSACETTLTQKQIHDKYKNFNLNEFVKDRYTRPNYVKISKFLGWDGNTKSFYGRDYRHYSYRILPDGKSIIYPVFMYGDKLYKPKREIERFCHEKGGNLYLKKRFSIYISGLYGNSQKSYNRVFYSSQPIINEVHVPDIIFGGNYTVKVDPEKVRRDMALAASYRTIHSNKKPDALAYKKAFYNNAFGSFVCKTRSKGKSLWEIDIKPLKFFPSTQELSVSKLTLLITPNDKHKNKIKQSNQEKR